MEVYVMHSGRIVARPCEYRDGVVVDADHTMACRGQWQLKTSPTRRQETTQESKNNERNGKCLTFVGIKLFHYRPAHCAP